MNCTYKIVNCIHLKCPVWTMNIVTNTRGALFYFFLYKWPFELVWCLFLPIEINIYNIPPGQISHAPFEWIECSTTWEYNRDNIYRIRRISSCQVCFRPLDRTIKHMLQHCTFFQRTRHRPENTTLRFRHQIRKCHVAINNKLY